MMYSTFLSKIYLNLKHKCPMRYDILQPKDTTIDIYFFKKIKNKNQTRPQPIYMVFWFFLIK
jgi:hypothetical protein